MKQNNTRGRAMLRHPVTATRSPFLSALGVAGSLTLLLTMSGCATHVSYFNAIETGPEPGQYFVSVVRDTHVGSDLVSRQSLIMEYRANEDGTWLPAGVVVNGVERDLDSLVAPSEPAEPGPVKRRRGGPTNTHR